MHIKNQFRNWLRGLWMLWTEALWAIKIWDLRLKQMKDNQFATRRGIPKRTVACSWLEKINSIRPIPQCSPNKPNHPSSTKTKPQILHIPIERPGHQTPCTTYQCSSGTKNTCDRKISDWPSCASKLRRKSDNNKKSALSSPKWIRKVADTLMCRIYSKGFTTIAKGGRSTWFSEKNKKLVLRYNTAHSLHRLWSQRTLVYKRQEISPKIKSMTNSTPTMIHFKERNLDSNMRERKPLRNN
jgi:hypothetical protein